jgi:hypothetical protein
MLKSIFSFFDLLEDKTRAKLSRAPLIYALVGSVGVVLFWRGLWHLADDVNLNSVLSTAIGLVILLLTGVFVSSFIGNRLIISGISGDKKLAEKTKDQIETEEEQIRKIQHSLEKVEQKLGNLKTEIERKHLH